MHEKTRLEVKKDEKIIEVKSACTSMSTRIAKSIITNIRFFIDFIVINFLELLRFSCFEIKYRNMDKIETLRPPYIQLNA